MLLDAGADVNAADKEGATALHQAAQRRSPEPVRMLLEAGADVNAADKDGATPLYKAALNGNGNAVRLLLDAGANVHLTSSLGWTALRQAISSGDRQCIQLLTQAGSDLMVRDCMGETLLMLAVCKGDWDSASSLFSVGGYELLSAQNCLGLTCLDMMPSGEGAAKWIKLVQARDGQCEAFVRNVPEEKEHSNAVSLHVYGGRRWGVSLKSEQLQNVTVALFRSFAAVCADHCMCPSGSAAYYELQVVHRGQGLHWGFKSENTSEFDHLQQAPANWQSMCLNLCTTQSCLHTTPIHMHGDPHLTPKVTT
jgi:ankyrin repeat protein